MNWASRWESERDDREESISINSHILKISVKPYYLYVCEGGQLAFFDNLTPYCLRKEEKNDTRIRPRIRLKDILYDRMIEAEEKWMREAE